ncbi:MAG: glycosyltransferase family 4 protein [Acidimicrobiia bacterium]|nr:glycosyltransferase family 4 protein [Acidimicrobiia bacterium]
MNVALVHDWLTGMRGGEKVLEVLCELFPAADLFTLVHERGSVSATIEDRRIVTSSLQRLPPLRRRYRHCLPLFPALIEQFDLDRYDLVISSSHAVAKAVVAPGRAVHVCYCHSPMRYAWDQFEVYFGAARVGARRSRWLYRPVLRRLARWDAATASRVGRFLANSAHVAGRIRRYYNRQATIVYPPVDTAFYRPDGTIPGDHVLIVSALVPYKRIDLAIDAAHRAGVRLRIAGDGPERRALERRANGTVEFLGRLSDEAIRDEYRRAAAVVQTAEEDFGIVPLEAQACGRPVVALGAGGALETVVDGETGVLVRDLGVEAWAAALSEVPRRTFDPDAARRQAERFSRGRCREQLARVIADTHAAGPARRW